MANFIRIPNAPNLDHFLNLDLITKILPEIQTTGGGLSISDLQPTAKKILYVIILCGVKENYSIVFDDPESASVWAKENLNISIPFDQLSTKQ